jgi:hypothetical protein
VFDGAVLSAGVHGLEDHEQGEFGLRVKHFLKLIKLLEVLLDVGLSILLVFELAGVVGIEFGELEVLAGLDEVGGIDHRRVVSGPSSIVNRRIGFRRETGRCAGAS